MSWAGSVNVITRKLLSLVSRDPDIVILWPTCHVIADTRVKISANRARLVWVDMSHAILE